VVSASPNGADFRVVLVVLFETSRASFLLWRPHGSANASAPSTPSPKSESKTMPSGGLPRDGNCIADRSFTVAAPNAA
jgi:hypothetical protein